MHCFFLFNNLLFIFYYFSFLVRIFFFFGHRNLIAFSEEGSDPYVRLYLLPDKRRSGRRKTHVSKKTLNPVFDQTYVKSFHLLVLHYVIYKAIKLPMHELGISGQFSNEKASCNLFTLYYKNYRIWPACFSIGRVLPVGSDGNRSVDMAYDT